MGESISQILFCLLLPLGVGCSAIALLPVVCLGSWERERMSLECKLRPLTLVGPVLPAQPFFLLLRLCFTQDCVSGVQCFHGNHSWKHFQVLRTAVLHPGGPLFLPKAVQLPCSTYVLPRVWLSASVSNILLLGTAPPQSHRVPTTLTFLLVSTQCPTHPISCCTLASIP